MIKFKQFLGRNKQNLHLEHLEDEVLNRGLDGIDDILKVITRINENRHQVSVKYDGAPAIVCGIDPSDNRFFVGTKAAFSKVPIYVKESSDLHQYDDRPELRNKMEYCFKYLQNLNIKNVLQGDLLFTEDSLQYVDESVYFTPNTITYKMPAKLVENTKLGIIFHTAYSGDILSDMTPEFEVNLQELDSCDDVWVQDANIEGSVNIDINSQLNVLGDLIREIEPESFTEMISYFNSFTGKYRFVKPKVFNNYLIKEGIKSKIASNYATSYYDKYTPHLKKEFDKRKKQLKSVAGKKTANKKMKEVFQYIDDNINTFHLMITLHEAVNRIKVLIIDHLEQQNTYLLESYIDSEKVGNEGYVVVDKLTNKAIKLVNRMEFSRNNFNNENF